MLIVTDKPAVDAAFAAKQPRPIRDVMLDVYPDAVEDRNGRFHAPQDGYECPLTGQTFRAGEFLPMEEGDDNYRIMGSGAERKLPTAKDPSTDEVFTWNGTRAQNVAVWDVLFWQTRAHDAVTSKHVGVVGGKIVLLPVSIDWVKGFDGFYGVTYIHGMKDEVGNVIIYKGSKKLGDKGARLLLSAKVKAHSERDGVLQTVVERPKTEEEAAEVLATFDREEQA